MGESCASPSPSPLRPVSTSANFGRATKRCAIWACASRNPNGSLANARPVLEVESSSTFSRPE